MHPQFLPEVEAQCYTELLCSSSIVLAGSVAARENGGAQGVLVTYRKLMTAHTVCLCPTYSYLILIAVKVFL